MKRYLFYLLVLMSPMLCYAERPQILPSDVVFMYSADDPAQYEAYQGTIVGWGGRARSLEESGEGGFAARVKAAHDRGLKYCGSVDFLVDFSGFIDFAPDTFMTAVCRDLDDKPLFVPWLWDHVHKGHHAYWFCFNNPTYQAYLRDQAKRVCVAPVDGLHIDDYGGTSNCSDYNRGCFCEYCMKGFRSYIQDNYSAEWIQQKGIADINQFDYKAFLVEEGVRASEFRTADRRISLAREFQEYQNQQMKLRIREVYEYAEQMREKPLLRSVNSSASSVRTLLPSAIIDYFCGEIDHDAAGDQVSSAPVFVYRLVEAVGDRQTATASGHDWAWIKANEKPGLVRTWIAQAYAFGSVFMVPHRQWCYTQELGTHWYHGKVEDFAYLYGFVREKAALLDGYAPLAQTAVLLTDADFDAMKSAAQTLAARNVPFALLYQAQAEDLPPIARDVYTQILTSPAVRETLQEEQLVAWQGFDQLPDAMKEQIQVQGAEDILVSIRQKAGDDAAPLVCHVLNQNYEVAADAVIEVTCTLSIQASLAKREIKTAAIHQPNQAVEVVPVHAAEGRLSFETKNLGLWAIVELN